MNAAAVSESRAEAASPSTEASATPDLLGILKAMQAAQRKSVPTYDQRIEALEKLEAVLLQKKDAIADAVSKDFGNRSRHETLVAEVFIVLNNIKYAKAHLAEWMKSETRDVEWTFLPGSAEIVYQPLGVIGIISPWNYPIQLALAPLVGVIAAGNRAMIKPAELTPASSQIMKEILASIYPADYVTVVTGGMEIGEAFSKLPFDHLVFTGSTRVGKAVMRAAAENLVPVTLELGGKSPAILGAGMSVETAAERVMSGKLLNAGQTCIAPDYVLVQESKRDAFVQACREAVAKLYPTLASNPDYTTIINARHYDRLAAYLEDAKGRGANVVELNPASETLDTATRKMAPALVLDATEEMTVMQDEIFGPILPIVTYKTIDDAIAYVNDHPRPLALYYFGYDERESDKVVEQTISGGVTINETMLHIAQDDLPFGGVGPSGMGHYHAFEGFESFSKKKPIFRQSRINATGFLRPPFGKTVDTLLKFLIK